MLEFEAEVAGLTVNGVDMLRWGADGRLTSFTVMVRPFKGLTALMEAMAAELTPSQRVTSVGPSPETKQNVPRSIGLQHRASPQRPHVDAGAGVGRRGRSGSTDGVHPAVGTHPGAVVYAVLVEPAAERRALGVDRDQVAGEPSLPVAT